MLLIYSRWGRIMRTRILKEAPKIGLKCLTCGVLSEAKWESLSQIFAMFICFWKNSSDCQIGLGLRPRPILAQFFSSNYYYIYKFENLQFHCHNSQNSVLILLSVDLTSSSGSVSVPATDKIQWKWGRHHTNKKLLGFTVCSCSFIFNVSCFMYKQFAELA